MNTIMKVQLLIHEMCKYLMYILLLFEKVDREVIRELRMDVWWCYTCLFDLVKQGAEVELILTHSNLAIYSIGYIGIILKKKKE